MRYQSAAWLTAGLLGLGLLWVGMAKPGPVRPMRADEADASVAAVVVDPPEPEKRDAEPPRSRVAAHPSEQPYVPASWRALNEDELMRSLNELSAEDSELALQLVGEARTRFPDSPRATERDYLEVRALVNLSRLDEAVAKSRVFVAAHPDDPLANDVARHLLTHPMHHPTEIGSR